MSIIVLTCSIIDKSDSLELPEVEQAIKTEQKLNFGPTMVQAVFKKFAKDSTEINFEQYLQIVTFLTNLSTYFGHFDRCH